VQTSSAGRLFDAVASLLGVCQKMSHEGQAALRLEALAGTAPAETVSVRMAGRGAGLGAADRGILRGAEPPPSRRRASTKRWRPYCRRAEKIALREVCLTGGCFRIGACWPAPSGGCKRRVSASGDTGTCPELDAGIFCLGQLAVAAARAARRADFLSEAPRRGLI
jgi:hydrogenase maturation protein HypF